MRFKLSLTLIFFLELCCAISAQKKDQLEWIDPSKDKIDAAPFFILPQSAVKLNMSVVEFTYTTGEKLRDAIKLGDMSIYRTKEDSIKAIVKSLKLLERNYDINPEIVAQMLIRNKTLDEKEIKTFKMDKDIKYSFISMADYKKMFRYKNRKGANSSTVSLEYDANGVLIASKTTDESKLLPAIFSTISGVASIITAGSAKGFTNDASTDNETVLGCLKIIRKEFKNIDQFISELQGLIESPAAFSIEKAYTTSKEKYEGEIGKEFSDLFYDKKVRVMPVEMIFLFPEKDKSGNYVKSLDLFAFNGSNGNLWVNKDYSDYYLYTPYDRIDMNDTTKKKYKLEISDVPAYFDRDTKLKPINSSEPEKLTAVYNIPKTERVRIVKPNIKETICDTVVKIPQHGSLGYISMRLSTTDLTYDPNGEIKKASLEKKSVFDSAVTQGATAVKDFVTSVKKEKPKTEIELLDEQAKKLELLKKIKELETSDQ